MDVALWTQNADYGGGPRWAAVGFSIANKGYAGLGWDSLGQTPVDFWQYDPASNLWTSKANFAGVGRVYPVSFVINNMGYICTGQGSTSLGDLWQYDPTLDLWSQKTTLPGLGRADACSFSIGDYGYVGIGGWSGFNQDLWQYNGPTDTWTQKANFATPRTDAAAFSICGKGYFGLGEESGYFTDLWQYDPLSNQWLQKASFPGLARDELAGFAVGNKGYFGLGCVTGPPYFTDFYEFTPDSICSQCFPSASFISSDTAFCTEPANCINFTDQSTCNPTSWHWIFTGAFPDSSSQQNPTNICYSNPGTYPVTLIVANSTGTDTLIISPMISVGGPMPPTITLIGPDTLVSSYGFSYQWYFNGSSIPNAIDSFYIATQNGTYSVVILDSIGCSSTSSGLLLSAKELSNVELKIYPNPARGQFTVFGLQFIKQTTIYIYDAFGKNVFEQQLQKSNEESVTIDISNFTTGIYLLEFLTDGYKISTHKIIVE